MQEELSTFGTEEFSDEATIILDSCELPAEIRREIFIEDDADGLLND